MGATGENITNTMKPEPAMVPAETAFRLHELANALIVRPVAQPSAALPAVQPGPGFSLTALANQLQTRFSGADSAEGEGIDLLAAFAGRTGSTAPAPLHHGISEPDAAYRRIDDPAAVTALMPSPEPKPAASNAERALHLPDEQAGPAVSRTVTVRQGDVFFMEPPGFGAGMEMVNDYEITDLSDQTPHTGSKRDPIEAMDLLSAPDARKDPLPVRQRPAIPFLPPPLPSTAAWEAPTPATDRGLGLVLGGAALILLGIYAACLLPSFWLTLADADAWTRQKTMAALVLHGAAALTALVLGTGSVASRRWAPPLLHAAGWVAALTVSGIIAATGFHLVNADAEAAVPDPAVLLRLLASLLVPLGCIFYYQQESTAAACERADPAPAWTDGVPVPALMVFLTGLTITAGAAAMLCHQPAFSLAGAPALTGPAASAAWALLGAIGLAIAVCVRLKQAAALWLLLLTALLLAALLSPAALPAGQVWENFLTALGRPAAAGPPSPLVSVLAALLPAPLLLVFAMARRSFPSPPPP